MKTMNLIGVVALLFLTAASCRQKDGRVLNLVNGKSVYVVEGESGVMIDQETKQPILLYVDNRSADTIYGPTGKVANGKITKVNKSLYLYDDGGDMKIKIDDGEYKLENGEVKVKREGDDFKLKAEDGTTIKQDGGGYKYETDGYSKKVDEDGDVKIQTKDKKIKIDGKTGEKKVNERSALGKIKDKVTGQ